MWISKKKYKELIACKSLCEWEHNMAAHQTELSNHYRELCEKKDWNYAIKATQLLEQIKKYDKPPEDNENPYLNGTIWTYLGGIHTGICDGGWSWYKNSVILTKIKEGQIELTDLIIALNELSNVE